MELSKGVIEMTCDRARERALRLSLGLFGAPADQAERDREARAAEKRALEASRTR
jgi:hypothetical protein